MNKLFLSFVLVAFFTQNQANAAVTDAPAFLEQQKAESCFIKKVLAHFAEKQELTEGKKVDVSFNFNGEKDVSIQWKRSRFEDQTINSKNVGYNATIRRFDSGLYGDQLDFFFSSETCDPVKIVASCNTVEAVGFFVPVKLVGGKCPEAAPVKAGWKAKPKPVAPKCPIVEELCTFLKGDTK